MSRSKTPAIAVLGLGAMGSRMAARLVAAGFSVRVWNRDAAKAAPLVSAGAMLAATPQAAAADADIILSMVTDDASARMVWCDPGTGAINGLKPGAVAIECSTVTPGWIAELNEAVAARGASLLDAPVAGSRPQAEAGQLIFMVGGSQEVLDGVRPVLTPLAAQVLHVGGIGQGAVLKLAVNALFAVQLASVAELLGFLGRNGFAAEAAAGLMGQFPIVAPPIAGAARMMAAGSTAPLFTIDLIEKDLGYILSTAQATNAGLPAADSAWSAFRKAQAAGLGHANISALVAIYR
jgi:3-hydroxyisobutyrate dehydrogenase